jgi:hypothetical protein
MPICQGVNAEALRSARLSPAVSGVWAASAPPESSLVIGGPLWRAAHSA